MRTGLAAALLEHFLLKALEVADLTGLRLVLVMPRTREQPASTATGGSNLPP